MNPMKSDCFLADSLLADVLQGDKLTTDMGEVLIHFLHLYLLEL